MKKVLLVLGALIVLLIAATIIAALTMDLDAILTGATQKVLPRVEATLGRPVSIEGIRTSFRGGFSGEILGLTVGSEAAPSQTDDQPAGKDTPLLRLETMRIEVALWPAIVSLGRNVQIRSIALNGLHIHIERDQNGTLSYNDIIERLASPEEEKEPKEPLSEQEMDIVRGLKLRSLSLSDAKVSVVDRAVSASAQTVAIDGVTFEAKDVALGAPLKISVQAKVMGERENFWLTAETTPITEELVFGEGPTPIGLKSITLRAKELGFEGITPYLPAELPMPLAKVLLDMEFEAKNLVSGSTDPIALRGQVKAKNLQVHGGESFDMEANWDLEVAAGLQSLSINRFDLDAGGSKVNASGGVSGLPGEPKFDNLLIEAPSIDLGRLVAIIPPLAAAIPPGSRLSGPASLMVAGKGDVDAQSFEASLNLTPTDISIPGVIAKPPGTPMETSASASITSKQIAIRHIRALLGPARLQGSGNIALDANSPNIDLKIDQVTFPFAGLARLLPAVAEAVPNEAQIGGNVSISGALSYTNSQIDSRLAFGLHQANLAIPGINIAGTSELSLQAKGDPKKSLQANASLSFDNATIRVDDVVNKPAGTPARLVVNATVSRGNRIRIGSAEVALGSLRTLVSGNANMGASPSMDLALQVMPFTIESMVSLVPLLKDSLPGAGRGQLHKLQAKMTGNPKDPSSIKVDIQSLDIAYGKSRAMVTAKITNNRIRPHLNLNVTSPTFHLDDFVGDSAAATTPDAAQSDPDLSALRKADAEVKIGVTRGTAAGFDLSNLQGHITLNNGILNLNTLSFNTFGGTLSASGSSVDTNSPKPMLNIKTSVKNVAADQLLESQFGLGKLLRGNLSGEFAANGNGLSWEALAPSLSGNLDALISQGSLETVNIVGGVVQPIVSALPAALRGGRLQTLTGGSGTQLQDLQAAFELVAGQLQLKRKVNLATTAGLLEFADGAIGFDQSINMNAVLHLSRETVNLISGGRFTPAQALPVGFKLGGTLLSPRVESVRVTDVVEAIAGSALKGTVQPAIDMAQDAKRQAQQAAKRQAEQARQQAEAARQRAQAEAQRRADEARRQADQARRKAEQDAKRRADEARRRAEQEAQRRADEAKNKAQDKAKDAVKGLFR